MVFPLDQGATIDAPLVEALPNQPAVNTHVFTGTTLGQQRAFGWAFRTDPKITIGYTYP